MNKEDFWMEYKKAREILDFDDESSRGIVYMLSDIYGPYTNVDIKEVLCNLETQTMRHFFKYERLRKQFEKAQENYDAWMEERHENI